MPKILVAVKFKPLEDGQTVKLVLDLLQKMTQNEYDRQICAFAVEELSKSFEKNFFKLLYDPFYKDFINQELLRQEVGSK